MNECMKRSNIAESE